MFKKIFAAGLSAVMLVGCSSVPEFSDEEIENTQTGEIVFIESYINFAEGYEYNGYFVDKNGMKYTYDFSDFKGITLEEQLEKMQEIIDAEEGEYGWKIFTPYSLKYMYRYLLEVDENAEFEVENQACDCGQNSLYGVRYDENNIPEAILIYSYGDNEKKPLDKNAQKIYDYYCNHYLD